MKKLTRGQISRLNSNSEIENNAYLNDTLGLETALNFDIFKDGCYLIEAKLDIRDVSNGLKKAQQELEKYKNKLIFLGMKLPRVRLVLDYETMKLYDASGNIFSDLIDFDFDMDEDYENYDIDFENGPNVAQQIYSRHPKINDSNIFDYFKTGIDWYNPTNLTQTDFRLVLDLFNDPETQRKRGAFYTPDQYIVKSTEMLRKAIKKVPANKDYVILDRCAGSGQLEKELTDEELSHCVLSTLGIAEWISLWNTFGTKVRVIIPPYIKGKIINQKTKPEDLINQCDFQGNSTKGADALSEQFYKDNEKHWKGKYVILLENPPYVDATSNMHSKAKKGQSNQTWVKVLMKGVGAAANDLYSQFVWSAWNIVKCNEYIVYGPIKQWKLNNLLNKHFNEGYLCNREFFHASKSAISLAWYSNKDAIEDNLNYESDLGDRIVKRILTKWNPYIEHNPKLPTLALMIAQGGNRNMQGSSILDPTITSRSHVRYTELDYNNLLKNLPLFVCNFWKDHDYTTIDVVMKTCDGKGKYLKDKEFLNSCGNWSYFCFENQSTDKSPLWDVLAKQIKIDPILLVHSKNVLKYAKIDKWVGLKFIDKTYNIKETNKLGKKVALNPQLDIAIKELKEALKDYYETHISEKMFKYELLK